ncbi:MAG TPA: glycosyltransferase family 39 protein [Anaerolineae bacterium]
MAASRAAGLEWRRAALSRSPARLSSLSGRVWLAVIIAAGSTLRVLPWLARYPLHRDEALYGAWARLLLSGRDPALLSVYVDKPPLVLYLLAASMGLFGASEFALRLPGLLAGIGLLAVTYGLARRLGGPRLALLAAGLVAASPYGILFAPTAFTDPWLALWLTAAAWAALARRAASAGLLLGLAIASKQTGILGLPLVLALLVVTRQEAAGPDETDQPRHLAPEAPRLLRLTRDMARPAALAAAGLAAVCLPVLYWDSLRWATRGSYWTRSLETYGGLHLAAVTDLSLRLRQWAEPFGDLFGRPSLTLIVVALAGVATWHALRTRALEEHGPAGPVVAGRAYAVIAGYIAGYLALHLVLTFQPWDRYLLPLLPLVAVLAARGARLVGRRVCDRSRTGLRLAGAALGLLLVGAAWLGLTGRVPIGSDHYAYAGLDRVAAAVRELPWTAVVYERSLGWQLDFYMFDSPPPHIWWDRGVTLADDAEYGLHVYPDRQQWLVLATAVDGTAEADARQALAGRGLSLVERRRILRPDGTTSFIMYQIERSGSAAVAPGEPHG